MIEAVFRVKKLNPEAKLPARAHDTDAGWDVCSVSEGWLNPGEYRVVPTGLQVQIPEGWEIQVRSRSGLAAKYGISVLNSPGTIDAGYLGEIGIILINNGVDALYIKKGDRIAQLVPHKVDKVTFLEAADDFAETERGTGGFGSSG